MKPILLLICLLVFSAVSTAEELHDLPAQGQQQSVLEIYGAADFYAIEPFLNLFRERYPSIRIHYWEFGTRQLYTTFLERYPSTPDLMMSSAMDLQIKLVNDGYARPYQSVETESIPRWGRWRNEIFGFTYEPAVIAVDSSYFPAEDLPTNRAQLLELIRKHSASLQGRIGTFDISRVGVGYLVWSHDSQQSSISGRLLESFSLHGARLFPSSSSMLEALSDGTIAIAYNLLGSYAHAWTKRYSNIQVIFPSDSTTLVMRTAWIPKRANNADDAKRFIDLLLSKAGQNVLANQSNLYPIRDDIDGALTAESLRIDLGGGISPIPLSPALLIQTDQASRRNLLEEWNRAMLPSGQAEAVN